MQLINNKRLKAGILLERGIQQNSRLLVITGLFSIHSIEMLKDVLPSIEQLRLLFSSPLDMRDNFVFIGDADERKLRNHLPRQFIAKTCKK